MHWMQGTQITVFKGLRIIVYLHYVCGIARGGFVLPTTATESSQDNANNNNKLSHCCAGMKAHSHSNP